MLKFEKSALVLLLDVGELYDAHKDTQDPNPHAPTSVSIAHTHPHRIKVRVDLHIKYPETIF